MDMLVITGFAVAIVFFLLARIRRAGGATDASPKPIGKKRRGPDMAFSAGRDPANQNLRLQQVFIPMEPETETAMREFYLGRLGLTEMRSPNYPPEKDGFWAVSGTRQIYLGTDPRFVFDPNMRPAFPVQRLGVLAKAFDAIGAETYWDTSNSYVTCLVVTDPAGNEIGLIKR